MTAKTLAQMSELHEEIHRNIQARKNERSHKMLEAKPRSGASLIRQCITATHHTPAGFWSRIEQMRRNGDCQRDSNQSLVIYLFQEGSLSRRSTDVSSSHPRRHCNTLLAPVSGQRREGRALRAWEPGQEPALALAAEPARRLDSPWQFRREQGEAGEENRPSHQVVPIWMPPHPLSLAYRRRRRFLRTLNEPIGSLRKSSDRQN
jgi:hypothetical protein